MLGTSNRRSASSRWCGRRSRPWSSGDYLRVRNSRQCKSIHPPASPTALADERRKGEVGLLARGDGSQALGPARVDAGGIGRRVRLHVDSQRQLLRGLRVLQLRSPLRARGHPRRAHGCRRQSRLRPPRAPELRRGTTSSRRCGRCARLGGESQSSSITSPVL